MENMEEMSMLDIVKQEKEMRVKTDQDAERLIGYIKRSKEEQERWEQFYAEKMDAVRKSEESKRNYWSGLLNEYFDSIPSENRHTTKTQTTYQLPSGTLTMKAPTVNYNRDEGKMLAWVKENRPEYVKQKESVNWEGLKKLCVTGTNVIRETGEVIDGLEATLTEPKFEVKI